MEVVRIPNAVGYNQMPLTDQLFENKVKMKVEQGSYEGQVKNGVPHGFGALTYENNVHNHKIYVGEFVDGLPHGLGHLEFHDGRQYDGMRAKGFLHGKGKLYNPNLGYTYEGMWDNDNATGYGVTTLEKHPSVKSYEGDHVNGLAHGRGKTYFTDGRIYEGEFENNNCSGRGIMNFPDGRIYDGMWKDNNYSGKGTLKEPHGTFTGDFVEGYASEGTWISHDHTETHKGTFKNGNLWNGTKTYPYGSQQEYKNGKLKCCHCICAIQ